jgi:hypothetical protein
MRETEKERKRNEKGGKEKKEKGGEREREKKLTEYPARRNSRWDRFFGRQRRTRTSTVGKVGNVRQKDKSECKGNIKKETELLATSPTPKRHEKKRRHYVKEYRVKVTDVVRKWDSLRS